MICDTCKGRDWIPEWNRGGCWKQCRNSAAWRQAQGAPLACPYGRQLNELPIGDKAPNAPHRRDIGSRRDLRGCKGCKDKMLAKLKAERR